MQGGQTRRASVGCSGKVTLGLYRWGDATSRYHIVVIIDVYFRAGDQPLPTSSITWRQDRRQETDEGLFLKLFTTFLDSCLTQVSKLTKNELLLVNIGSTSTGGRVLSVKADLAKIQLTQPACTEIGEKVALSRRIDKHWRLVGEYIYIATLTGGSLSRSGWGSVQRGTVLEVD